MSLERAVGQMVQSAHINNPASSITDSRRPPLSPSSPASALRASPPPPPLPPHVNNSDGNTLMSEGGASNRLGAGLPSPVSAFIRSVSVDSTSSPSSNGPYKEEGLTSPSNHTRASSSVTTAAETEDMFLELFLDTSTVVSDERKLVTMLTSIGFDVASTSSATATTTFEECPVDFQTPLSRQTPNSNNNNNNNTPSSTASSEAQQLSSVVKTTETTTNPLLYILEDLQMVDTTLLQFVSFWQAYELVLGMLLRREEHTETLLTYATSSRSINKALSSLEVYARFWKAFTFLSGQYVSAIDSQTVEMYSWLVGRASHLGQLITNN